MTLQPRERQGASPSALRVGFLFAIALLSALQGFAIVQSIIGSFTKVLIQSQP